VEFPAARLQQATTPAAARLGSTCTQHTAATAHAALSSLGRRTGAEGVCLRSRSSKEATSSPMPPLTSSHGAACMLAPCPRSRTTVEVSRCRWPLAKIETGVHPPVQTAVSSSRPRRPALAADACHSGPASHIRPAQRAQSTGPQVHPPVGHFIEPGQQQRPRSSPGRTQWPWCEIRRVLCRRRASDGDGGWSCHQPESRPSAAVARTN